MNAIRRDEDLDNTHSIYVDQWDWEKVISKEDRNVEFLKDTVRNIYQCFLDTQTMLVNSYDDYEKILRDEITFVTTEELEELSQAIHDAAEAERVFTKVLKERF